MKEAMKKTNKLKFILTFLFSTLSLISSYGVSFAFAYFMTDPLTPEKLEQLKQLLAKTKSQRNISENHVENDFQKTIK